MIKDELYLDFLRVCSHQLVSTLLNIIISYKNAMLRDRVYKIHVGTRPCEQTLKHTTQVHTFYLSY